MLLARELLKEAREHSLDIHLPVDHMVAKEFTPDAEYKVVTSREIPPGWVAMDKGPHTFEAITEVHKGRKTILWNGPMGVFEMEPFSKGTEGVAKAVVASGAISIVGGGETIAAIRGLGLAEKMTHISTGGGAALELLEGKTLPGMAILDR